MSNASDEEPEIVVIAQKEVVIRTEPKTNDAKTKKHASTSNQKMMNETTDVFKMVVVKHAIVDLGD